MHDVIKPMNSVLSDDLEVITKEINSYTDIVGEAIFEIGKRLKHVKENDLTHGQFGTWLKESVRFTDRQARRLIQVVEEFKVDDVVRFGPSKIFELLHIPKDQRQEFIEQSHTIPSTVETKTIDEMTIRKIREAKKARIKTGKSAIPIDAHIRQRDAAFRLGELENYVLELARDMELSRHFLSGPEERLEALFGRVLALVNQARDVIDGNVTVAEAIAKRDAICKRNGMGGERYEAKYIGVTLGATCGRAAIYSLFIVMLNERRYTVIYDRYDI